MKWKDFHEEVIEPDYIALQIGMICSMKPGSSEPSHGQQNGRAEV